MKIVYVLAPLAPPRDLLQDGTVFFRDQVDQGIGIQFPVVRNPEYLDLLQRFVEGDVDIEIQRVHAFVRYPHSMGDPDLDGGEVRRVENAWRQRLDRVNVNGEGEITQLGRNRPEHGAQFGGDALAYIGFGIETGRQIEIGCLSRAVVDQPHEQTALEIQPIFRQQACNAVQHDFHGLTLSTGNRVGCDPVDPRLHVNRVHVIGH